MRAYLLAIFLFSTQLIFVQNYKSVDSLVDTYPKKFKTIERFADRINTDFKTDIEKTRAAYYWISSNISYDDIQANSNKSVYEGISSNSKDEYKAKLLKQERKYAEECLKKKKAVCEGYSQLLKFTLLNLNIECEVIVGFAKTELRDISKEIRTSNHAWNAVKLNDKWRLIDATWSTRNTESNTSQFDFDDSYFLAEPKSFVLNHFPEKQKWQLLEHAITKARFFALPIVYQYYFNSGLEISSFNKGILKVDDDKTIELLIKKIDTTKVFRYAYSNESMSNELNLNKKKTYFTSKIPYKKDLGRSIIIYNNFGEPMIEYKIE